MAVKLFCWSDQVVSIDVLLSNKTTSAWKWIIFEGMGEKHLAWLEHTPMYLKCIKKNQIKQKETTDHIIWAD